jgi:hypothetical protein
VITYVQKVAGSRSPASSTNGPAKVARLTGYPSGSTPDVRPSRVAAGNLHPCTGVAGADLIGPSPHHSPAGGITTSLTTCGDAGSPHLLLPFDHTNTTGPQYPSGSVPAKGAR